MTEPKWLQERREAAKKNCAELPIPTTEEFWRRTNLSRIKFDSFTPIPTVLNGAVAGDATRRLPITITVSGELLYGEKISPATLEADCKTKGVILSSLSDAIEHHPDLVKKYLGKGFEGRREKFLAQNEAFWQTGAFLYVPQNTKVELPLLFASHFSGENKSAAPRLLIILDKGAKATVVHYASSDRGERLAPSGLLPPAPLSLGPAKPDPRSLKTGEILLNNVVEIYLEEEAHLNYIDLQALSYETFEIAKKRIEVGRNAKLKWVLDIQGSRLSKTDIETVLNGEGASAEVLALTCGNRKQHLELCSLTQHVMPHTTADILVKGAADDQAKTVFQGMIRIEKAAQGTESYMANNNLVLSDKAHADSIPRLEIEADEVKASHGATIGQVDAEQLFYLQTRGMDRETAEHLIVEGFYEDIFGRIPEAGVRELMRKNVETKVGTFHHAK